jgi:hypothetical protein
VKTVLPRTKVAAQAMLLLLLNIHGELMVKVTIRVNPNPSRRSTAHAHCILGTYDQPQQREFVERAPVLEFTHNTFGILVPEIDAETAMEGMKTAATGIPNIQDFKSVGSASYCVIVFANAIPVLAGLCKGAERKWIRNERQ